MTQPEATRKASGMECSPERRFREVFWCVPLKGELQAMYQRGASSKSAVRCGSELKNVFDRFALKACHVMALSGFSETEWMEKIERKPWISKSLLVPTLCQDGN
jgi:hypothetical protein